MAPSIVQNKSAQNTSSAASIAVTFNSAIGSGNFIVALVMWDGQSSALTTTTSNTDTATNAFGTQFQDLGLMAGNIVAFFNPVTGGATTVTASFSPNAAQQFLTIYEVTGYTSGTVSWDKTSSAKANGQSSPATSGTTATLSQAVEMAFGAADNSSGTWAAASPWTQDNLATSFNVLSAHQVTSSTTGIAFTQTFTGTVNYGAAVATIQGTIPGGAAQTPYQPYFQQMLASKRGPSVGWREGYDHRWRRWRRERGLIVPTRKIICRAA